MTHNNNFVLAGALTIMATSVLSLYEVRTGTFADDVAFLRQYVDLIVLSDRSGDAKVAVAPCWQGRVMTSTARGDQGMSFGWINRELIVSRKILPHMNPFGGEDRFWLGPEGGQFSIFFARGARFELSDWFTPAPVDTLPFEVLSQSRDAASFSSNFTLENYSGTRFDVGVRREVRILEPTAAWNHLRVPRIDGVSLIAYESDNTITNMGRNAWKKQTGLLSVWILGMFKPSPATTIVVPIVRGPETHLGTKVTSDYFGAVPPERLRVEEAVIYFSGDGQLRSKIGISPRRSKGVLGSYDADSSVLTIVQFSQPTGVTDYVNSLWRVQDEPYAGDAVNAYNDGSPAPGARPLGPFYELESSSPAAELEPGNSLSHVHRTVHLTGAEAALDVVAREVLQVPLALVKVALKAGSPQ